MAKRINTAYDMQGSSISGLPLVASGTSDDTAASTQFVARAIAVNGARTVDLVNRQANAATLLNITADTVVAGSDFIWRSSLLPAGCRLYLEINGFGSVAGLGVIAGLFLFDGTPVTGSSVTVISTTAKLAESASFIPPADGTPVQVKFRNSSTIVGTGSLLVARLNIRPL